MQDTSKKILEELKAIRELLEMLIKIVDTNK